MNRFMVGQQSLSNFFESVQYSHPSIAEAMHNDIMEVAIFACASDKSGAQGAVDRLRRQALELPELLNRILHNALTDLGFE